MMAACASVPKEDLKSYSDAFAEAQQAGNLYLDEVATAAQVLAEREALANPASADAGSEDSDFDPRTVPSAGASADPPAVTARRQALMVIVSYNELLVRLAKGESADGLEDSVVTISKQIAATLQLVSVVNPLLSTALGAVGPIMDAARRARSTSELRTVLIDGHDKVAALIQALIDDTPTIWRIIRDRYKLDIVAALAATGDARREISEIAAAYRIPTDPDLMRERQRVEDEMNDLRKVVSSDSNFTRTKLGSSATGPAYTPSASALLNAALRQMGSAVDSYRAAVAKRDQLRQGLVEYVRLLRKVRDSLEALVNDVQNPDVVASALAVTTEAVELRSQAQTLLATFHNPQ